MHTAYTYLHRRWLKHNLSIMGFVQARSYMTKCAPTEHGYDYFKDRVKITRYCLYDARQFSFFSNYSLAIHYYQVRAWPYLVSQRQLPCHYKIVEYILQFVLLASLTLVLYTLVCLWERVYISDQLQLSWQVTNMIFFLKLMPFTLFPDTPL